MRARFATHRALTAVVEDASVILVYTYSVYILQYHFLSEHVSDWLGNMRFDNTQLCCCSNYFRSRKSLQRLPTFLLTDPFLNFK